MNLLHIFVVASAVLALSTAAPYNGWGPGEDYGHAGSRPPTENPNSVYGYDYFDTMDDNTSYGARYNPFKKSKSLYAGLNQVAAAPAASAAAAVEVPRTNYQQRQPQQPVAYAQPQQQQQQAYVQQQPQQVYQQQQVPQVAAGSPQLPAASYQQEMF